MNPILNAKNKYLDFAAEVSSKRLVDYITKLKSLVDGSHLDNDLIKSFIEDCELKLKELLKPSLKSAPSLPQQRKRNYL